MNKKITLSFVPQGGGEIDYSLDFQLTHIPRNGDYIVITKDSKVSTFIVKRTWYFLNYDKNEEIINVECEFAKSSISSEEHNNICDNYAVKKNRPVIYFEDTNY